MATRVSSTHSLTEVNHEWVGLFMNVRDQNGILHRDCKLVEFCLRGVELGEPKLDFYLGTMEAHLDARMALARTQGKIRDGKHHNNLKNKYALAFKAKRKQVNKSIFDRLALKKKNSYFFVDAVNNENSEIELLILG